MLPLYHLVALSRATPPSVAPYPYGIHSEGVREQRRGDPGVDGLQGIYRSPL